MPEPENTSAPPGGGTTPPAGGQPPAPTAPPAPPPPVVEDVRPPPNVPEAIWREHLELRRFKAQAQREEDARRAQQEQALAAKLDEVARATAEERAKRETLERQLATAELDRQFLEANPELRDGSIRDYVRAEYERRADKAQTVAQWLASDAVKTHTALSRLLAPTGAPPPRTLPRAPDPSTGAGGGTPTASGAMTAEEMLAISRNPQAFAAARAKIKAETEARLGIKIGAPDPVKA